MKTSISAVILSALIATSGLAFAGAAQAEPVTLVGVLSKIKMAADGKSAVATLKDSKSGETFTVNISDDLTLDKFKDKRIVEGDEIRTKFEKSDGKSKSFKKTAGC